MDNNICLDFARIRGDSLEADLRDRDFTLNAMAADLLGDPAILIDPLQGVSDLRAKVLRRCSPGAIENDPIRALRAVRLSIQIKLKIHPETAADIRRYTGALTETSGERIRDEFFKLLGLDQAARGLRVLQHLGVLEQIVPDVSFLTGLRNLDAAGTDDWSGSLAVVERMRAILTAISTRRTDNTAAAFNLGMLVIQIDRFRAALQAHIERIHGNGRRHGELLVLAALLHKLLQAGGQAESLAYAAKRAESVADALKLTNDEKGALIQSIRHFRQIVEREAWTDLDCHRFWFQLGAGGIDAVLLGIAYILGSQGNALVQREWLERVESITTLLDCYFNRFEEIVQPTLLLNGNDVKALLNISSGPMVGTLLNALREAQVTGEVRTAE